MQNTGSENGYTVVAITIAVTIVAALLIGGLVWWMIGKRDSQPPPSQTVAPQRKADIPSAMMPLSAQNNSGLDAKYQIIAVGNPVTGISSQTRVVLNVNNAPQGISMPAHLHSGSCANLGAVKYSLSPVVNGASVTTLDSSIFQIKLNLPLAVNIHKSVAEAGVYVACADVNSDGSLDAIYNSK